MEKQNTLFQYLYRTLSAQIEAQIIRKGECLPSIQQLAGRYNVGVRTVKDVLKALGENGYIQTQERKNSVVVFGPTGEGPALLSTQSLLAKQRAFVEVLNIFHVLFPHILASACLLCSDAKIRETERVASTLEQLPETEQFRLASRLTQSIISNLNNPLLTDLYIDLVVFCELPLTEGPSRPFSQLNLYLGHRAQPQPMRPDGPAGLPWALSAG